MLKNSTLCVTGEQRIRVDPAYRNILLKTKLTDYSNNPEKSLNE